MALTAVREHERASTMPRLHRANTVAWGLLNWGKCCMIVVCHWSTLAWQCMAFLLGTVGSRTPHNMPQGGKPCHISKKAYPSEPATPPSSPYPSPRGIGNWRTCAKLMVADSATGDR